MTEANQLMLVAEVAEAIAEAAKCAAQDGSVDRVPVEHVAPPSMSDEGPLLLSVTEAAKVLGIGEHTMRSLVRHGAVRRVRIGRRTRVVRESLRAWVAANSDGEAPDGSA